MSGTPRLRSAFPASPPSSRNTPRANGSPRAPPTPNSPKLPDISSLAPSKLQPGAPFVSFDVIDAPSQRLYAFGIFALLWIWRLYDWSNLMADETESLWFFMKWLVLDLTYLYFLESAHIPWLEFSPATQSIFFAVHAILNGLLMFRIPIRFLTWFGALVNYLWDSELAISGNSVKYSSLVNNPSLILGRQIIHVLPEGSAILNPDNIPLCLDPSRSASTAFLPLRINQTVPISIELVRFDLETSDNETLTITASQSKKLRKEALKGHHNAADPLMLRIPVQRTGLYRIHRIVDETRMDVQLRHSSEALVVTSPSASVHAANVDRCRGDLSDLSIRVQGTPPLRVKFRKTVGDKDSEIAYQSIQPDEFVSPLIRQGVTGPLAVRGSPDLTWARPRDVKVPMNESLDIVGKWIYSIDQVTDALNNAVNYTNDEDGSRYNSQTPHTEQVLVVHDRPKGMLQGPGVQKPLLVAKGKVVPFPIQYSSSRKEPILDTKHFLEYRFTPFDDILENGEHSLDSEVKHVSVKNSNQRPSVSEPGLYTLRSISTEFCQGEVLEPSSFLLTNPAEPELSIASEVIADTCADKAVGLRVGFELVGTPPFKIQYVVKHLETKQTQVHTREIAGLSDFMELKPSAAGHYTYTFTRVSDAVYSDIDLIPKNLRLETAVKPSASAQFTEASLRKQACIDELVSFDIRFSGEAPFGLEYEIVHGGRRTKQNVNDIQSDRYTITTPPLSNGGEYSIVLTGVKDSSGCRQALRQDAVVQVRHQRPKAGFGVVEGKRALRALEGRYVDIPLRMTGEGPWTVEYGISNEHNNDRLTKRVKDPNDLIRTKEPGQYRLLSVRDSVCPGTVDESSDSFEIAWIERPDVRLMPSEQLVVERGIGQRRAICEGQEDAQDVFFGGRPPYDVVYVERIKHKTGQRTETGKKEIHVPLNSAQIKMDSSHAGVYEYDFIELGDYNYEYEHKKHVPIKIRQEVYGRPSAVFKNPGKVYSICQSQDRDHPIGDVETIPIHFPIGQPPFELELELTRPGRGARPEILTAKSERDSRDLDFILRSARLIPGTSTLTLRRVRDSLGCERIIPLESSPRVQISVHDLPNISPLEPERNNVCVGERIAFSLSGMAPYTIFYSFGGKERKATETSPTFRRLAERPGNFSILGVQDAASSCRRPTAIDKTIHPLPSVKISHGRESRVDIHAGGDAEMLFEFGGTPPFEFTYVRSENAPRNGKPGALLETKTLRSDEMSLSIRASDEGTYEVVSVRDAYCSFTRPGMEGVVGTGSAARLLKNV